MLRIGRCGLVLVMVVGRQMAVVRLLLVGSPLLKYKQASYPDKRMESAAMT